MILVDHEIIRAIEDGSLVVDPFDESLVNPASLDIRLGNVFGIVEKVPDQRPITNLPLSEWEGWNAIDPTNPNTFETILVERDTFCLKPGCFIIATTLETIGFGSQIAGIVKGKSSLGRLGLANSSVAGFIDPAFKSRITLELYNYSKNPILLKAGMKIGQIVFYRTEKPTNDYSVKGRYMNQIAGMGSLGI